MGNRDSSFTVSSTMVVRVDRMPSIGPSRSRRICERCEGLLARILDQTIVTSDVMHLEHIRHSGDCLRDPSLSRAIRRADRDEREHRTIHRVGIDLSGVAFDDPPGFQLADAFQNRRRRRGRRPCDICLRETRAFSCSIVRIAVSISSIVLSEAMTRELYTGQAAIGANRRMSDESVRIFTAIAAESRRSDWQK